MELKKSKVLYLTHDGLTDPLGQSQILPYLLGLSKDFSLTIISFEKQRRFAENKKIIIELCEANNIEWIPLRYHNSPPIISTVFDIFILRKIAQRAHKKNQFKIVHCRSYMTSLIGLLFKRKHGLRFVFDMRGFWADERIEGGIWNLKNPLYEFVYSYFKAKEKVFFGEADAVVSLTHKAKDFIVSKFKVPSERISVIPCSVDLGLFDPQSISEQAKDQIRRKLGILEKDFVLIYLGSLGTWYLYEEMVNCFDRIKQMIPESKFLILTPDADKIEHRPDFVVRSVPRKEVPLYCSLASASVLFIKPSFSKMASSATKMAELMAMNVTVITNPGWGDAEKIINDAGGILYSDNTDINEILRAKFQTRNYCYENLDLTRGVTKYKSIYYSLLDSGLAR